MIHCETEKDAPFQRTDVVIDMVGFIRVSLVPLITLRSGGVGMVYLAIKMSLLICWRYGCSNIV